VPLILVPSFLASVAIPFHDSILGGRAKPPHPDPVQKPNSNGGGGGHGGGSNGGPPPTSGGGSSSPPSSGSGPSPPASDGSSSSPGGSFFVDGGGVSSGTPSPSSSGGERDSSSSSTTTPGTPSSPSTQTDPSIGIPQPSASSILTGHRTLSQGSTSGGNHNSTSTSVPNIPVAHVSSMSLPHSIQKGVISGSPASFTQTGHPSSTNGPNGTGTNNNPESSALVNPHHQLSSGGTAAIITVFLLLFVALPFIVFIFRRRSKIQRYKRQTKGWSVTIRTSQTDGDLVDAQLIPDKTQTVSSSLATNIDHSESDRWTTYVLPPLPLAMAEMGRGKASRPTLVIDTNNDLDGISIASAGSDRSQYLITSTNPDSLVNTAMFVRPFSASESFAFPKPPESAGSAGASVMSVSSRHTRRVKSVTSVHDPPGLPLPMVPHAPTIPTVNPFMDHNPFADPSTRSIYSSVYWDAL